MIATIRGLLLVRGIIDNYTKTGFTVFMDPSKQTRINWLAIGR